MSEQSVKSKDGKVKVLVVFDLIPNETLMAINWIPVDIYERMKLAHNKCMNSDTFTDAEMDGFEIINNAFLEKGQKYTPGYQEFVGLLGKEHAVDGNDISDVQYFIHTSYYL